MAALRGLPDQICQFRLFVGRGKKRLTALADWEFGGGAAYCQACTRTCPDCPQALNAPLTYEGWQVWDLVQRLGGQLRIAGTSVISWDLEATLQLGAALGVPPKAMAELLPAIKALMVRKINEEARSGSDMNH